MSNHEIVFELVSELTKKNAQTKKIQNLCQQLKIPFNGDLVELMTLVLGSGLISKGNKQNKEAKP